MFDQLLKRPSLFKTVYSSVYSALQTYNNYGNANDSTESDEYYDAPEEFYVVDELDYNPFYNDGKPVDMLEVARYLSTTDDSISSDDESDDSSVATEVGYSDLFITKSVFSAATLACASLVGRYNPFSLKNTASADMNNGQGDFVHVDMPGSFGISGFSDNKATGVSSSDKPLIDGIDENFFKVAASSKDTATCSETTACSDTTASSNTAAGSDATDNTVMDHFLIEIEQAFKIEKHPLDFRDAFSNFGKSLIAIEIDDSGFNVISSMFGTDSLNTVTAADSMSSNASDTTDSFSDDMILVNDFEEDSLNATAQLPTADSAETDSSFNDALSNSLIGVDSSNTVTVTDTVSSNASAATGSDSADMLLVDDLDQDFFKPINHMLTPGVTVMNSILSNTSFTSKIDVESSNNVTATDAISSNVSAINSLLFDDMLLDNDFNKKYLKTIAQLPTTEFAVMDGSFGDTSSSGCKPSNDTVIEDDFVLV